MVREFRLSYTDLSSDSSLLPPSGPDTVLTLLVRNRLGRTVHVHGSTSTRVLCARRGKGVPCLLPTFRVHCLLLALLVLATNPDEEVGALGFVCRRSRSVRSSKVVTRARG